MSYKTLFGKSQIVAKAASLVCLSESQMSLRNQLRTGVQMLKKDKDHPPEPVAMPGATAPDLSPSEPRSEYQEELEPWQMGESRGGIKKRIKQAAMDAGYIRKGKAETNDGADIDVGWHDRRVDPPEGLQDRADDAELSDIRDASLDKNENLVDQSLVDDANAKLGEVWKEAKRKLNKENENKKNEKN